MNDEQYSGDSINDLKERHKQLKTAEAWLQLMLAEFRPHDRLSMNGYITAAQDLQQSVTCLQSSFQQTNQLIETGAISMTPPALGTLTDVETTLRVRDLLT